MENAGLFFVRNLPASLADALPVLFSGGKMKKIATAGPSAEGHRRSIGVDVSRPRSPLGPLYAARRRPVPSGASATIKRVGRKLA
jgi:hypothetical protein